MKKHWWKSKTIWFNAVSLIVYVAQGLSGSEWIKPDVLIAVTAVGNGILRTITHEGIGG